MKILLIFLVAVVCLAGFACNKESHKTVFKGKYMAKSCWPVIQILEPLDEKFKEPKWYDVISDSSYNYCVGVGEVPEKYRDGKPFYFTIKSITRDPPSLAYCIPTKYIIGIATYSDTSFTK
ncbi:hypothetical protein [Agriterribacter sp.]|uniref:hypothetical protein n=1 Tax=Agriterribacter sp. TaxID=2821509 RepID=UPI002C8DBB99|nr:hypothetical protein [Agriterribacter sp.]HRP55733.1 hypothetical protein [Agriterribacter sp.]